MAADADIEDGAAKKGIPRLFIIIGAAAVVVLLGGAGLFFFLSSSSAPAEDAAHDAAVNGGDVVDTGEQAHVAASQKIASWIPSGSRKFRIAPVGISITPE